MHIGPTHYDMSAVFSVQYRPISFGFIVKQDRPVARNVVWRGFDRMEAPKALTGVGSGEGISPPQWGWGLGSGLCPLPRKILVFSPLKWCILMHSGGRLDQL